MGILPDTGAVVYNFTACGYHRPMPIYEFHCADCEKNSELLVRSSDWSDEECPHCGSGRLVKQLSTFAPATPAGSAAAAPQCTGNPGACGLCE